MIISCEKCTKKFEIDSNLIPENGRLLRCGSCDYVWFFKVGNVVENKDIIEKNLIQNENIKKPLSEEAVIKKVKNINGNIKKITKKNKLLKNKNEVIQKTKSINILSIILIFIISIVALLILIDTFQLPISLVFPSIENILYSLYETIKDIILFLKDLF
jgi:predicted Zn finger-like uncharacterized protein